MKKIILSFLICLIPVICFAQVRSKVCVVRPNYSDEIVNEINDFIPRLKKLGLENPEEYISDFLTNGISGSGFIYVAPDGKNYVITNRHVIEDATTSTVIFQKDDNNSSVFEGLTLVAASEELDLALLAFPENAAPFAEGFDFFDTEIQDGDNVYTAGYPSLLGSPSWQFGSGIVTNSNISVKELIKPELSSLIQHSAQIDAGNSGGPLLVKSEDGSYKVAGINTWKITNRQDTNFSIPAKTIKQFVNDVLSGKSIQTENPEIAIHDKAMELQKVLNKFNITFEELIGFISIDYVAREGKQIFDSVVKQCNDENRSTLNEILKKYSPIEGMRYAIAWYVYNEYHKYEYKLTKDQKSSVKENELPEVSTPEKYEDSDIWATALFLTSTKRAAKTEWEFINGGWQLRSIMNINAEDVDRLSEITEKSRREIPEEKASKLGSVQFYTPSVLAISYGKSCSLKNDEEFLLSHVVTADIKLTNFFALNISATVQEPLYFVYSYDTLPFPCSYIMPMAGLQVQFPLQNDYFVVTPYVALQGGVELRDFSPIQVTPVTAGKVGGLISVFLGKTNFSLLLDINTSVVVDLKNHKVNDVNVNIGTGFAL